MRRSGRGPLSALADVCECVRRACNGEISHLDWRSTVLCGVDLGDGSPVRCAQSRAQRLTRDHTAHARHHGTRGTHGHRHTPAINDHLNQSINELSTGRYLPWARTIEDLVDARVVYFLRRPRVPLLARADPRARPWPLVLRDVGRAEVGRHRSVRREQHDELRAGQDSGSRCRTTVQGQGAGPRCRTTVRGEDSGSRCRVKMQGQGAGPRCRATVRQQPSVGKWVEGGWEGRSAGGGESARTGPQTKRGRCGGRRRARGWLGRRGGGAHPTAHESEPPAVRVEHAASLPRRGREFTPLRLGERAGGRGRPGRELREQAREGGTCAAEALVLSQSTKALVLLSALLPPSLTSWSARVASPRSRNEVAPPSASSRSRYDASRSSSLSGAAPPLSSRSLTMQSAPIGALTAKFVGLDRCSLVAMPTLATSASITAVDRDPARCNSSARSSR